MKKILIIDDNMLMRKLIINLLKKENYQLEEAENGVEGLKKIIENQYDLIITDIVMPQMEGIEMIRHAKLNDSSLKILAISGGEPFYLFLAKKLGVEAIFTKPLDYEKFLNTIKDILQAPCKMKKVV
jgi:YesN/AraC family two-component response regulator